MKDNIEIIEKFAELVEQELTATATLTDIEQTTRALLQELGRQSVVQVIEHRRPQYAAAVSACACGEQAEYVRQRKTRLHTLFGQLHVKRAYYLCSACHTGHFPLDDQLGLRPNALSAELERLAALTGVQLPFKSGSQLFYALTLVSLSDQTLGKATRALGQQVVAQEDRQQTQAQDAEELLRQKRTDPAPHRLYGAMDATKVHVREKNEFAWRDLKIGAWFEADSVPPEQPDGEWSMRAKNIRYYTDICQAAEFGQLFWGSGVACRAQLAQELIILGDGAEWIWNLVEHHFPQAIQILDWFHACEHLMPVAQVVFESPQAQAEWVSEMKQFMWAGEVSTVIADLERLAKKYSVDILRTTANYFSTHQLRMRYAYFRQQGYLIGSGTIESGAKQIGMMRMKVPGASWNENGGRLVSKARAAYLSDGWLNLPLAV